jgi:hypothetical protein
MILSKEKRELIKDRLNYIAETCKSVNPDHDDALTLFETLEHLDDEVGSLLYDKVQFEYFASIKAN